MEKFTVIWRPIDEEDFRFDCIEAKRDRSKIMRAAAQSLLDEFEDDDMDQTVDDILSDYEVIAILDGHAVESVGVSE